VRTYSLFSCARSLTATSPRPSVPVVADLPCCSNLALAAALVPVAGRHGVTPAAIAVAWTLSFPAVTGAIVGARSPEQVGGWLPAATLELKEDDLAEIAAAIRAAGAGTGPASPPLAAPPFGKLAW
jgi:diketogulonate reductase-like aldo/keto reductase